MDLRETRRIPMWLAHPALPVGGGALLLLTLLGLELMARARPEAPEPEPAGPRVVLGPDRVAGQRKVAPPPTAHDPFGEAVRAAVACQRRGDYLGALAALRALPPEVRAAHEADIVGQEQALLQSAGERLLFELDRQEPGESIAALTSFLLIPGAAEHPVAGKVEAALRERRAAAQPGD